MVPNVRTANVRLSHLQGVHADLLKKLAELASLRKQVELKEAALRAKAASRRRKMLPTKAGGSSHVQRRTAG
jgi:hypothetical protein